MRFFLSVKRTALLGIFISTFMFTGYAHSEQPVVTYENKPMAELRKSGPYKKAKFIGHINDFTPEQLRELFSRNKELLEKSKKTDHNNSLNIVPMDDFTPERFRELLSKNKGDIIVPIVSNNNVSSSSSFDNKTPRKLRIDDFIFPIALLIFISIMSIPISLLWRFGLKVPASLFIITTAGISCSMLLLLAFG